MTSAAPAGGPRPRPAARWPEVLAVVLLSFAGYSAALHGTGYTIDDHVIVDQNARLVVERPGDLWRVVATPYWAESYQEERLWRPVVLLSFAVDRALLGAHPDRYHAVNVALHTATAALALLLFLRLVPSRPAALAGALLFALHPVHAEAVAGLVGRAEVLGLGLALAGMVLHLRGRDAAARAPGGALRDVARGWAPALLFLLAFGAKEVALTAPFVLVPLERVARAPLPPGRARWLAPYGLYLAAIVTYFVARALVLQGLFPPPEAQSIGVLPLTTRLLVAGEVCRDALAAMIAPGATAALYPFQPPRWTDPRPVLTALAHLGLLGLAGRGLAGGSQAGRAAGLGLLAFYMSMGPVSNLIPIGVVFAERLLYTPSVWAMLVLAALAAPLLRGRRLAGAVVLGAVLALAALRLEPAARAWTDDALIWQSTLRRFGDQLPKAHHAYAGVLIARGHHEAAVSHAVKAVQGMPHASSPRATLAALLRAQGRPEDARVVLLEARAIRPNDPNTLNELVQLELALAEAAPPERRPALLAQAERTSREAIRAVPHDYGLWLQRGTVLSHFDGREPDAEAAYDRAIERRADPWEALFNRARLRYARAAEAAGPADRRAALEGAFADYRRAAEILGRRDGPQERLLLPSVMFWTARLAGELERPAEGARARAWLERHRPDLLPPRLDGL